MKKTYIIPMTEVYTVQAQNLLAGSLRSVGFESSSVNAANAEGHGDDADWGDDEY